MQGFEIIGIKNAGSLNPGDEIVLNMKPLTEHEIDNEKWDSSYTEIADLDKAYPDSDQEALMVKGDINALQANQAAIVEDVDSANKRYTEQIVPIQEAAAKEEADQTQFKDALSSISFAKPQ